MLNQLEYVWIRLWVQYAAYATDKRKILRRIIPTLGPRK